MSGSSNDCQLHKGGEPVSVSGPMLKGLGTPPTFDEGGTSRSTNPFKAARSKELPGERAPSQKRALLSETRFGIRSRWDFSAGLWIENLHLWKLWALGDQIILNSYVNSCILTRKADKL